MQNQTNSRLQILGVFVIGVLLPGMAVAGAKATAKAETKKASNRKPAAVKTTFAVIQNDSNSKLPGRSLLKASERQRFFRVAHARELMGPHYGKSVVKAGESVVRINTHIYEWTKNSLPKAFKKDHERVAQAIIDQSLKHSFDPVFVMSVIMRESSFNPLTLGGVGEIGLMQLRPETAAWIAGKNDIKFQGKETLKDPVVNIELGTAYLAFLRDNFDSHARLYLAAYNMGQTNVRRALKKDVWPKDYASKVMENYVNFYRQLQDNAAPNDKSKKSDGKLAMR